MRVWICRNLVLGMGCCGVLGSAAAATGANLADLVEKVGTSVVSVQSARFLKKSRLMQQIGATNQPSSALGTGFILAAEDNSSSELRDSWILTNAHVVEGATEIEVLTSQGSTRYLARVHAVDAGFDVALLQAKLPRSLSGLRLGSSRSLRVGESVLAIGNPFGLGHTVTSGILSAKDRSLGVTRVTRYLQTDAAINFGNSGGPLFNLKGEVVGMNTLIRIDAQGIGFAIPSDTLAALVPKLVLARPIVRQYLGVGLDYWSTAWGHQLGSVGESQALVVTKVFKGSPAERGGLKVGDQLLSVSVGALPQRSLKHPGDLEDVLLELAKDQPLQLELRRGTQRYAARLAAEPRRADLTEEIY